MTRLFPLAVLTAMLSLALPAWADDSSADMLNKAYDLVHQAWNPGGDPPSDAQRTDLLTKALDLTKNAPDHHLKGTRKQAMLDIQAALDLLKNGDSDHKAGDLIHKAADDLRDAISLAQ